MLFRDWRRKPLSSWQVQNWGGSSGKNMILINPKSDCKHIVEITNRHDVIVSATFLTYV